ncbi:DUF4382 domain-containing protein [Marinoscillum sp.]|uniref:DUF4382 domain-containing protein n=1 Tax=Marinoscillum sp. TaxID=2024838 RepID=UPI003BAADF0B
MKTQILVTLLVGVLLLASCEERTNDSTPTNPGTAAMRVVLVDDPAAFDAVLIDVIGLEYKYESDTSSDDGQDDDTDNEDGTDDEDSENHWVTVEIEPMVFDLLELNNGNEALLADIDIPEGELKEVRLILGENNHLVIEGDTLELKVPSGSSSGLKIKIDADIEEGNEYKLVLDFDAARSIVKAGNSGKYNLKPVIHATLVEEEDEFGAIEGVIWPDTVSSVVYVIHDEDSVSTIPEETGYFLIELLEEGDYEVVAVPEENSGFSVTTMTGVNVMDGAVSNIDTLTLEMQ